MEAIENAAYVSIGRASGFAGLAIACVMFGFAFDPPLAARIGGILCLGFTVILASYALRAKDRPYKRTELWLILHKQERPPARIAQKVIGSILRETYLWFAKQAAIISVVLLAASMLLHQLGISSQWKQI